MMRNRATPQQNSNGDSKRTPVEDQQSSLYVPPGSGGVPQQQYQQPPGGYPPNPYYQQQPLPPAPPVPFHKSKAGQYSALALLVCCCCCIGAIGVAGSLSFAVYTGAIHIDLDSGGGRNGDTAAAPNKIPEEPQLSLAEIKKQAKAAALEHHEKNQEFVELANKKAVLQVADSNPHMEVDLDKIATILPVTAKTNQEAKTNTEEEEMKEIERKEQEAISGGGAPKKEKPWKFEEIKFKVPDETDGFFAKAEDPTKPFVKDRDGDRVMDDMLAKDIAAGRQVDTVKEVEEETDIEVDENRWDHSEHIPQWLKEYFDWHKEVSAKLCKKNWHDYNYIVMTCLGGEICGNVAHRLRPLMAILRVAAESKRMFYIHWDLPDKLEKFLTPRQRGGIQWAVPEAVMWKVRKSLRQDDMDIIRHQSMQTDRRVVNAQVNNDDFGETYYNSKLLEGEADAQTAFHEVWDVLFRPSFMLEERVRESTRLMGLTPGEYASVHIDYDAVPASDQEREELKAMVENAMNCMSGLRPGGPFLVAAQTFAIAREAIIYGKHKGVHVHAKQIAHDTSTTPNDLYVSFVEIMLMANTKCVAYSKGGYGQLGYILGWDFDCKINYSPPQECEWTDGPFEF